MFVTNSSCCNVREHLCPNCNAAAQGLAHRLAARPGSIEEHDGKQYRVNPQTGTFEVRNVDELRLDDDVLPVFSAGPLVNRSEHDEKDAERLGLAANAGEDDDFLHLPRMVW